jgi:broad specificity phosphatase PhoE
VGLPETLRTKQLPARITFISHAATQATRRAAFPRDEPVEDRELAKIAASGWQTPRARHLWSGPERRVVQTAESLGLSAAVTDDLRDCDYGAWRGQGIDELQSSDPEALALWLTDPAAAPHEGESIVGLIDRVGSWLDLYLDLYTDHAIAVTHPTVIRAAIIRALNAPPQAFWRIDIAPLSLTDLRFNGRAWTLRCVACPLSVPAV